jgi:hypothetical protein
MSHEIPDWELAMYRLGDLPTERAEALAARLEVEPELAARLAALEQRESELMDRLPPRVMAAQVAERAQAQAVPERAARRRKLWWLAAELAVVALLLVLVLPPVLRPDQVEPFTDHGIRDKGVEPYLRVYRQVPGGFEELDPQDPAGPGSQLQLSYAALGRNHGAVLSIDGRGEVTLHLPLEGTASEALQTEGTVDLPSSYKLDDAPGFERFFLITSREPFELSPVLQAADTLASDPDRARSAALDLHRPIEQADFLILKHPVP